MSGDEIQWWVVVNIVMIRLQKGLGILWEKLGPSGEGSSYLVKCNVC
jgi:hypothetical protein